MLLAAIITWLCSKNIDLKKKKKVQWQISQQSKIVQHRFFFQNVYILLFSIAALKITIWLNFAVKKGSFNQRYPITKLYPRMYMK